jgi:hypothetical protein
LVEFKVHVCTLSPAQNRSWQLNFPEVCVEFNSVIRGFDIHSKRI